MENKNPLNKTRVLIVDDHAVVRRGLTLWFQKHDQIQVVGELDSAIELVRVAKELRADVVVMDLQMPEISGIEATELLKKEVNPPKVVMLSMHMNTEFMMQTIKSGALGFVSKTAPLEELAEAILAASRGETHFSSDVAKLALTLVMQGKNNPEPIELTPREVEIVKLVADGKSNKEMSLLLGIALRTVETHRERVMRKLQINSIADLTHYAIARGLVSLKEKKNAFTLEGLPNMQPA